MIHWVSSYHLLTHGILQAHPQIKSGLNLGDDSVVLCFSTEGATDMENYRNVVWYGKYTD